MARYIREVELNQPDDFVQFIMSDFLGKHGFQMVNFKGEQVYRTGGGFIEIPKFLVWGYQNGIFHIEVWTRNVWLPGVYGKENALTGFSGSVPKSAYKKDIEELIGLLYQPINNVNPNMAGTVPSGAPSGQPVYVRGTDMSRYASLAFIFSLVGALLSFFIPLVGIIFGALAVSYGKKSRTSSKKGLATAGFVIGIIAIVLGAAIWILNFVYLMS